MALHNDASSLPLRGCVFCCTSIPPESRSSIASTCIEMGGIHKLDLTPHVTHLIVGQIDTPKYKYIARERPDIRVLLPSFIEAVRQDWLEGGDVDLASLESKHAVLPFHGLTICATGFSELDGRQYIQDTVQEKGGTYSGDLTKMVTHLVAAKPEGRKYEYAAQWRVKIVSMRWILDSVERGMALEESFFHPALSHEEQGKGAVNLEKMQTARAQQDSAGLGKRPREEQEENSEAFGKRKLRRTASSRLTSQNDGLWADIGQARQTAPVNEKSEGGGFEDLGASKTTSARTATANVQAPAVAAEQAAQPPLHPSRPGFIFKRHRAGAESGERFFIQGFDSRKTSILSNYLSSAGGMLLSEDDMLARFPQPNSSLADSLDYIDPRDAMPSELSVTVVVPHTTSPEQLDQFQREPHVAPTDLYVTDFWVEKCLHRKTLVPQTKPLCEPFKHPFPLQNMQSLTICPTCFSSIDLLHFSKAVKLTGAAYDETLTQSTGVLVVCDTADTVPGFMAHNEKVEYAAQNKIPIVSEEWFWDCLQKGKKLPLEGYGMMKERDGMGKLQFFHPLKRPKSAARAPRVSAQQKAKEKDTVKDKQRAKDSKEAESEEVLKDLQPEVNSPPKRKRSPLPPVKSDARNDDSANVNAQDENQQDVSNFSHTNSEVNDGPTQRTANLNNAIAELLAQKRVSGNNTITNEASEMHNHRRKHRPLGRALSNTSSLGDASSKTAAGSLSRSTSLYNGSARTQERSTKETAKENEDSGGVGEQKPPEAEDNDEVVADSLDAELSRSNSDNILSKSDSLIKREKFRPSQALSYEDPEAAAVRERVLRRLADTSNAASEKTTDESDAAPVAAPRRGRFFVDDHDDNDSAVDGPRGAKNATFTSKATAAAKGVRVASIGTVKDSMGVAYTPGSETFSFLSNSMHNSAVTGGVKAGAAAAAGKRRRAAAVAGKNKNVL